MARSRVVLDYRAIDQLLDEAVGGAVRNAAATTRDRARSNLARAGRMATGRLALSIEATQVGRFVWHVGSPLEYAEYQEFGIGPVYPVRAKVLRFKPKGSSTFIFRPYSSGFPGAYFMTNAYKALTEKDFRP